VSCHYCLASSIENHNRLSEQGELWRLLEWAKTQPLLVRQQIDGTVDVLVLTGWGPHPNPAPTMDILVWGCDSMFEALREAKAAIEERESQQWGNDDPQFQCTICGRIGTVGRCCGRDTRIPLNDAARQDIAKDIERRAKEREVKK
jgi:hypothetical protein